MALDKLYGPNSARLLAWLEAAPPEFFPFLAEVQDRAAKLLRQESEMQKMYQAQGRLEVLDLLLTLKTSLREYLNRQSKTAVAAKL